MKSLALILAFSAFLIAIGCYDVEAAPTGPTSAKPKKNLPAFRSEYELKSFLKKFRKKAGIGHGSGFGSGGENGAAASDAMSVVKPVTVEASASSASESVTNVQHAGVDEGGIVKVHGDHLVILRRGRLFTVSIKDNSIRAVSSVDAFGPGIDPEDSWYDEMLISEHTIVVIGYNYERGGTEIGLFNIDDAGGLKYRSTYHLRSNDYYSSRNYSSRLIGDKLIFYAPFDLSLEEKDVTRELPALRKWRKGAGDKGFKRIIAATRIYRGQRDFDKADSLTLHTVTTCDLRGSDMTCEATSVLGPSGNVFYVSPRSVYVWAINSWNEKEDDTQPILYRMPLDGSAPSALEVSASPVDQFSFLESEDGHLNVLVRSESSGDGMWAAESAEGDVALMRVAIDNFSDGSVAVPASNYRQLLKPSGYSFQNRFIGDFVLYGSGGEWDGRIHLGSSLYAARWDGSPGLWTLPLPHGVDRIEPLGSDAMIVGTDGKTLHFSSLRLAKDPTVADRYEFPAASQGETRSHGFFYKPDSDTGGILGLPIVRDTHSKSNDLFSESAAMVFLENRSLRLRPLGELNSQPERAVNDDCKVSCVDWYGNARPLFLRGRIFALLGYELVEGQIDGGAIKELRRTNFAPAGEKTASR